MTKKGETLLQKARQRRLEVLKELLEPLSERDHRTLAEASRILLKMAELSA